MGSTGEGSTRGVGAGEALFDDIPQCRVALFVL
jgi:hypothetical protein